MKTRTERLVARLKKITLPQSIAFAAGVIGLYLWRDHIPTSPDGWKELGETIAAALVALSALGAFLNGRESPKEEP